MSFWDTEVMRVPTTIKYKCRCVASKCLHASVWQFEFLFICISLREVCWLVASVILIVIMIVIVIVIMIVVTVVAVIIALVIAIQKCYRQPQNRHSTPVTPHTPPYTHTLV